MADKKAKIPSVKEAFAAACETTEIIKAYGHYKVGDKITRHKSTIKALRNKKLVK